MKETLAGTGATDANAPKAAIYIGGIDPAGPTRSLPFAAHETWNAVSDDALQFVVL